MPAALIATQTLGLAVCRYLLQLPPIVAMSHDEIVARLGRRCSLFWPARNNRR